MKSNIRRGDGGMPGQALAWFVVLFMLMHTARAGWVAYNDSAFKEGQANAENVTTYGLGRNFEGEGDAGGLRDFTTGETVPVSAAYVETFSTGSVNSGGDTAFYAEGSDAEGLFGGIVDISGNMSYGDSPGWHVDLTITGLDPARNYTFAATANRNGGPSYAARVTNWRILGAESFVYASSSGARKVAEDSVEFSTGDNATGNVARWLDIRPGADGIIVIRTSHSVGEASGGIPGASLFQGYAGGAFMVREQPPGDFRWVAFNDSAYKAGQVNSGFVSTVGLGRNFEGQGSSAVLKSLYTGTATGVTATYTETLSTGSVNSAGDAAPYTPGSDAEIYFRGAVDLSGNMSYGDSPGWHVDLAFTGLDPSRSYTFVGTANRNGGAGYAARVTNWRILGADEFTYGSSAGARRVGDDSVEFSTGDNAAGLVARWTDVRPGADGSFTIRTSHSVGEAAGGIPGASPFQGYSGGVFLLAEQLTGGGTGGNPVEIVSLLPADGAAEAHPDTPVTAVLEHGDAAVDTASIVLKVDGVAVTPVISATESTTTVSHALPGTLQSASSHTVSLSFTDSSPQAVPYAKEWSFTVLDYSGAIALPASMAVPFDPSVHQTRGFAMEIVAPESADDIPLTGIDEAAAVFDLEYHNTIDAALFNSRGYHIETGPVNYQLDGLTRGAQAGDRRYPGVPGGGTPQERFALRAHTLLHLRPGYHRMNITAAPGFQLFAGAGDAETELPFIFGPCTNCGGDDAPWYTEILITQAGLYPFRLLHFSTGGSASLEWLTVSPSGTRPLTGGSAADAIAAYVPSFALPPSSGGGALEIRLQGNSVSVEWGGAGALETATDPGGLWTPVPGAVNPHVTPAGESRRFFRVRK